MNNYLSESTMTFDDEANSAEALREKLLDVQIPGLSVAFDPEEASFLGAFFEDALSEEDALQSRFDGVATPPKDSNIAGQEHD